MLNKSITKYQWFSLVILTIGVVLTQISAPQAHENSNSTYGFLAVLLAACTSGFSGVYFEKILKGSVQSLWIRNIQMGIFSVIAAYFGKIILIIFFYFLTFLIYYYNLGIYMSGDGESVRQNGFFYGYNKVVWMVILLQALGGLIVAVVVKYADNILKGFASSFSIITSCIFSILIFDFKITMSFLLGSILVNWSIVLYADPNGLSIFSPFRYFNNNKISSSSISPLSTSSSSSGNLTPKSEFNSKV